MGYASPTEHRKPAFYCEFMICLHFDDTPLKRCIFPSSANDMLLRSVLKANVSLMLLLLFSTLEGSCFAYDEMIVRVSGRERVVLNVVDSNQRRFPPSGPQAISFTFPPVCGQSAANLPQLHASCLRHPPNTVCGCVCHCQVSQGGFCTG